jgi:hypothetical protein
MNGKNGKLEIELRLWVKPAMTVRDGTSFVCFSFDYVELRFRRMWREMNHRWQTRSPVVQGNTQNVRSDVPACPRYPGTDEGGMQVIENEG